MVMTDSGAPQADDRQSDPDSAEMLTTGQAAEVIGYGTTRKQVISMIATGRIAYVRPGRGTWARIPMWAALAKRRELYNALTESEAEARRHRLRDQQERDRIED